MNTAMESETKLDVDLDFTVPDLRRVVPRATVLPPEHLWSTYLDSRDLRLWARSITLRHRRATDADRDPGVWTLKLPVRHKASRTDRSEHTWVGTAASVPCEAREILLGVLRREPLHVVTELECIRRRITLHDEGGRPIGEVDDDSVIVHGGRRDGLRFHEVEFEVAEADDRVDVVLDRLQQAGARQGSASPKLSRALGSSADAGLVEPGRKATTKDVVRWGIGRSLNRLVDQDYRLRADPIDPSPKAIHQARVATRRLRSDLKTFGAVLDPIWVGHIRDDLRWLGSALGEVRDRDVLAGALARERRRGGVDSEGYAVLMATLRRERREACRGVIQVLACERYLNLLDKLHAAEALPPLLPASVSDEQARNVLPSLAAVGWKKLEKSVRRAERRPTDRHLHKVRIAAKQVRYAAELSASTFGRRAESTAKGAKELQTILGRHQDAVIARTWLHAQAERSPGFVGFSAGQAAAGQRHLQDEARSGWGSRWLRLDRPKRRGWLGLR